MRLLLVYSAVISLAACNNHHVSATEKEVDSIRQQLSNSYKPGFGEFMSSIQMHHAKLWFAGTNENWELADFELHEILETTDAIKQYCSERPESKMLDKYLPAAVNGVSQAITQKNIVLFKERFLFLTNSCNNCHRENNFGFNVVTIPTAPPVTNQDFRKTN